MKKIIIFGLVGIVSATSANAGWWSKFNHNKKSEPTKIEEVCNKDEIAKFCPETTLVKKTLLECMSENVTSLSTKCADFVNNESAKKAAKIETKKAEMKANAKEVREQARTAKMEIKSNAKEIKKTAKATGKSMGKTAKNTAETK